MLGVQVLVRLVLEHFPGTVRTGTLVLDSGCMHVIFTNSERMGGRAREKRTGGQER